MNGTFWMLFIFILSVSVTGACCLWLCEWMEKEEAYE